MRFSRTVSMKPEILLGQRQHGNLAQVDLLATREVEQQVERPFVAADIDVHHLVVGRRRGLEAIRRVVRASTRISPAAIGRNLTELAAAGSGNLGRPRRRLTGFAAPSRLSQPLVAKQSPPCALICAQMLLASLSEPTRAAGRASGRPSVPRSTCWTIEALPPLNRLPNFAVARLDEPPARRASVGCDAELDVGRRVAAAGAGRRDLPAWAHGGGLGRRGVSRRGRRSRHCRRAGRSDRSASARRRGIDRLCWSARVAVGASRCALG